VGFTLKDSRITCYKTDSRQGILKNYYEGIKKQELDDEDIIIFLDGDDWLSDNEVLEYLNQVYQDESVWLTWGSFQFYPKGSIFSCPSKDHIFNPRCKTNWTFSHLRTAKYFLWKNIREDSLKDPETNAFFMTTGDVAMMLPMLEMAGELNSKFISKVLYVYNHANPLNDDKINTSEQSRIFKLIRSQPNYPKKTKKELIECYYKV